MKTSTLILIIILVLVAPVLCAGGKNWEISILNVFDSYVVNSDLESHTAFGCVIRTPKIDILFDTGYGVTAGAILLSNMEKMNIDPKDIDIVVISHFHCDKGLEGFLKKNANVKVYVPGSDLRYKKKMVKNYGAEYLEVGEFSEITEDVYSTGAMEAPYALTEQSLVIDTKEGLVVITGCAHPGIVNVLKRIKEMLPDKNLYLVMGGFHLRGVSEAKLESIIKEFKRLGVKKVAPSHCSGDSFRELSKREYKKDYIEGGVGQIISF